MNGELNHIKEFVQKNLEECYYEMAEEMMLINPLCGVIQKFIIENKIEEERIRNGKLLMEIKKNELKKKAEKLEEKEKEIKAMLQGNPSDKHIQEYIIRESNIEKLEEIKRIICGYFDVNIDRKTRQRDVVYAREMAMYYGRKLTDASLEIIGREMGRKDHSTVSHAIKTIENFKYYKKTRIDIEELDKIFNII